MLNDNITVLLEKAISGASIRHNAILNNIANVNTPGYKRTEVDFKTSLKSVIENNRNGNISQEEINAIKPEITKQENTSLRNDGNNVDVEKEMSLLAKNNLEYQYYMSLLSKRVKMIKTVINESRG